MFFLWGQASPEDLRQREQRSLTPLSFPSAALSCGHDSHEVLLPLSPSRLSAPLPAAQRRRRPFPICRSPLLTRRPQRDAPLLSSPPPPSSLRRRRRSSLTPLTRSLTHSPSSFLPFASSAFSRSSSSSSVLPLETRLPRLFPLPRSLHTLLMIQDTRAKARASVRDTLPERER